MCHFQTGKCHFLLNNPTRHVEYVGIDFECALHPDVLMRFWFGCCAFYVAALIVSLFRAQQTGEDLLVTVVGLRALLFLVALFLKHPQ